LQKQKTILVVGSVNIDLVATAQKIPAVGETVIGTDFQIYPGGKGANQAVAIARLGYPVHMLGCLGSDDFGLQLRNRMAQAGVCMSNVVTVDGPSGTAVIEVSSKGENSIVVAPGANHKLTPRHLEANISLFRQASLVLAQLEIPIETIQCLSSICRRERISLILDPAPACELTQDVFRSVAWFTPNESEAAFYTRGGKGSSEPWHSRKVSDALIGQGCSGVVLKLGSKGAYLTSKGEDGTMLPAFDVTPIDSTAAGDAFNGAFAVGLICGKTPRSSAEFACAAAAISVTRKGAQPSMPSMAEVNAFVAQHANDLSEA
jgi:ribokinase